MNTSLLCSDSHDSALFPPKTLSAVTRRGTHDELGACVAQVPKFCEAFPFHPVNGLPLMFLDDGRGHVAGFFSSDHALFSDHHKILTSVADETNQNLNGPQKELLLWHHKLGHINFDWLQALARHGRDNPNSKRVFESKFSSIGNCRAPLCAACQMGKGKRRTTGAKKVFDVNAMKLKEETLQPGDRLHIDQYKSNVTGRLQTLLVGYSTPKAKNRARCSTTEG
jgi:GAG-pre-integrase domain